MRNRESFYSPWAQRLLSVLRIVAGFLFFPHGAQKLFNYPESPTGAVPLASLLGVSGIIEFFGGLLLLIGLFTRPVAFILAGEMAVAYFLVHAPRGFLPLVNQGELTVLYCFVYLLLATAGPGPWSLDTLIRRRN